MDEVLLANYDHLSLHSCLALGFICWNVTATITDLQHLTMMPFSAGHHEWMSYGFRQVGVELVVRLDFEIWR